MTVLAGTGTNDYEDDFTSEFYCDTLNTTALWDTIHGEFKLPPFELALFGSYDTPGGSTDLDLAGDIAFVADTDAGLVIIDITDPSNPALPGAVAAGSARRLDVEGDYVYVAGCDALYVIDVRDPLNPMSVGSCDTPGYAKDVAAEMIRCPRDRAGKSQRRVKLTLTWSFKWGLYI